MKIGGAWYDLNNVKAAPRINTWAKKELLPGDTGDFYCQVEKMWRAFVKVGALITGRKTCFNLLIQKERSRNGDSLPADRTAVRAKEIGAPYYNSRENKVVQGSLTGIKTFGQGPSATAVHLKQRQNDITLQKNVLYIIAGEKVNSGPSHNTQGESEGELEGFSCTCGAQLYVTGPHGRKRTCRERHIEGALIRAKFRTPFQHCVRLPTNEILTGLGWERDSFLGRHVQVGYDLRICNLMDEHGRKSKFLSFAAHRECPEDYYGIAEELALKNPTEHCGLSDCVYEEFVTAKELLRMIPGAVECLACPDNRFREQRSIKPARWFEKYLAGRRFAFDSVSGLAEFFRIDDDTIMYVLMATKGLRAFFKRENTDFMSGVPSTAGNVLLKNAPTGEKLLRGVYCILQDLHLYREADDTPVHILLSADG